LRKSTSFLVVRLRSSIANEKYFISVAPVLAHNGTILLTENDYQSVLSIVIS